MDSCFLTHSCKQATVLTNLCFGKFPVIIEVHFLKGLMGSRPVSDLDDLNVKDQSALRRDFTCEHSIAMVNIANLSYNSYRGILDRFNAMSMTNSKAEGGEHQSSSNVLCI